MSHVSVDKLSQIFALYGGWFITAQIDPSTAESPVMLIVWAAIISGVGGVANGMRKTRDWFSLLQSALNTGILGASLMLFAQYYTEGKPTLNLAALGFCGLISLGGMESVDFIVGLIRRKAKNEIQGDK